MIVKTLKKVKNLLFPSVQFKRVQPWVKIDGDRTLRMFYDGLNEQSVIFDLGGFEGQWASDIYAIYNSNIYVFEPFKLYADKISNRFKKNAKIKVFDFGLGSIDRMDKLAVLSDSSSIFKQDRNADYVQIRIKEMLSFLDENLVTNIDLLKINIEGAEYDVIEHLISSGFINNIRNIQVQFHDFVPNAKERMYKIQASLKETHNLTYQYEFVWENWEKKD